MLKKQVHSTKFIALLIVSFLESIYYLKPLKLRAIG